MAWRSSDGQLEEFDFDPNCWAVAAQAKARNMHSDLTKPLLVCLLDTQPSDTVILEYHAVRTLVISCVVSAARASKVTSAKVAVNRHSLFSLFIWEAERQTYPPCTGSLPTCAQQLRLGQVKARSLAHHPGLPC